MRILRTIIEVTMLPVCDARQHRLFRGPVAFQLIGDDDPWDVLAPFEELAEERLGGALIAPSLHQNIEHGPVLIDRPPQIVTALSNKPPSFPARPAYGLLAA